MDRRSFLASALIVAIAPSAALAAGDLAKGRETYKMICENCHGPVATRDALFRETDLSMGGCMDCHRRNKAPNDCNFCHEPR